MRAVLMRVACSEMNCAGNGTDYSPEAEIPVGAVGEIGSVRCGEEEQ
jgi:hypothetical protein